MTCAELVTVLDLVMTMAHREKAIVHAWPSVKDKDNVRMVLDMIKIPSKRAQLEGKLTQ